MAFKCLLLVLIPLSAKLADKLASVAFFFAPSKSKVLIARKNGSISSLILSAGVPLIKLFKNVEQSASTSWIPIFVSISPKFAVVALDKAIVSMEDTQF